MGGQTDCTGHLPAQSARSRMLAKRVLHLIFQLGANQPWSGFPRGPEIITLVATDKMQDDSGQNATTDQLLYPWTEGRKLD